MASKFIKPKEGPTCAVATCIYHNANKAKRDEKVISFYKFPKNLKLRKQWTLKCKIMDDWNPIISYICSNHFCENDFMRDLKAELFESNPKKLLKPEAVPTQNLPIDHVKIQSTMSYHSTTESKTMNQAHDQILSITEESLTHPSTSICIPNPKDDQILSTTDESLTQPSTSTSIFDPELDQIKTTKTEESLTHPSRMTSILDPEIEEQFLKLYKDFEAIQHEPEPEIEQFLKLYKDFEAIQHENETLLEKWNCHIRYNASVFNELKLLKKTLRTTNLKIKESDRRVDMLNQTLIHIQKHAKEFRMGYHKEN